MIIPYPEMILSSLQAGIETLMEYLSAHVLTCLIPAFFIAGAIVALLQKDVVLKYFGADAKKWLCYSVAATSGTVLAVCSCTILPMFAGIHRRGAGIGPATAFLFSGPAINLLAVILTARVLGLDLGIARIAAAVSMAIVIGLVMAAIFERRRVPEDEGGSSGPACAPAAVSSDGGKSRPSYVTPLFLAILVGILLGATSKIALWPKAVLVLILTVASAWLLMRYFEDAEKSAFFGETWWLAKRIFPLLVVGTFITGVIGYFLPVELIRSIFGRSDFLACFIASFIGALLYMPTLLEVPIVGTLFGYSSGVMASGPALALLLAGPSMSLPNMIVIWRVIGARKTGVYIALVIILSTLAGMIYGAIV